MNIIKQTSKGINFGIKFTLEVLGASGAIWGASEVLHLRNSNDEYNNTCWRIVALTIGGFALIRFAVQNTNLPSLLGCEKKIGNEKIEIIIEN